MRGTSRKKPQKTPGSSEDMIDNHIFSYGNLNKNLAEHKDALSSKDEIYVAKRGNSNPSGWPQGSSFLYVMNTNKIFMEIKEGECLDVHAELFFRHGLKFHISLPEDEYAKSWPIVSDIFMQNQVALFKIPREGVKMSKSHEKDQEEGEQRGKDITVYAQFDRDFSSMKWGKIMQEITSALVAAGVKPGYRTVRKEDHLAEENKRVDKSWYDNQGHDNPYISYRYEKSEPPYDPLAHEKLVREMEWCLRDGKTDEIVKNQPWNGKEEKASRADNIPPLKVEGP